MTHNSNQDLLYLSELAREAGQTLLTFWPGSKMRTKLEIETKQDGSFVTQADLASSKIIEEGLIKKFPEDFIVSEEGDEHGVNLTEEKRAWVIDPLDGTHPFIEGRDDFSVLISLVEFGKPTVGIMYFPARDILVTGIVGGKAIQNEKQILKVSESIIPREKSIYVRNCEPNLEKTFHAPQIDSGLALYKVAAGEFDGTLIQMTAHKIWDIAAPLVCICAAGGKVSDQFGKDITLSGIRMSGTYFVSSNSVVHEQLLGSITS